MNAHRPLLLKGEKVGIGPLMKEDAKRLFELVNNLEITQYLSNGLFRRIATLEGEEKFIEDAYKGKWTFAVVELEKMKLIGLVELRPEEIDAVNAELAVAIFAKDYLGKGYGSEAIILALDYGFNVLGFSNIWLKVFEFNKRAIRAYEKIGFKFVGRIRRARFRAGRFWDVLIYDMLAEEFNEMHESRVKELCKGLYL